MQHRAVFARSETVSMAMQNIGEGIFHPMGSVSSIDTRSSTLSAKGENNPRLGASPGRSAMM